MEMSKTFTPTGVADWRSWLEQNSAVEREIWLVFYRPQAGQPTLSYEESVREALCWGWIDSLIQRIDDDRYARLFTRRVDWQKWSETNRRRVRALAREGRIQPAVLALIPGEVLDENAAPVTRVIPAEPPAWLLERIQASPAAWATWEKLSPSQRRLYIGWILDAKKEETRLRRADEAVGRLERGLPLGFK